MVIADDLSTRSEQQPRSPQVVYRRNLSKSVSADRKNRWRGKLPAARDSRGPASLCAISRTCLGIVDNRFPFRWRPKSCGLANLSHRSTVVHFPDFDVKCIGTILLLAESRLYRRFLANRNSRNLSQFRMQK